ncbi:MAG: substrate-binding domain-containing protein [Armatimonadetes bacterium]|nr:substrate-binding domain-containing protein [Armatimonadota bacterium]
MTAEPIYRRIESDLRAAVAARRWAPGQMLPSRQALCREYGVALATLQRALAGLLADGTLRAEDGRGTFVATAAPTARPRTARLGIVAEAGQQPSPRSVVTTWAPRVVESIERAVSRAGGVTSVHGWTHGGDLFVAVPAAVRDALASGADAVAVVAINNEIGLAEAIAGALPDRALPLVMITHGRMDGPLAHVFFDGWTGGHLAAEHLVAQGYHRLAFLAPYTADWLQVRLAGAQSAAARRELVLRLVPDEPVAYVGHRADQRLGEHLATAFLAETVRAEPGRWGLIAPNDACAYGVLAAAQALGLRAGRDFGLVGFDDDVDSRRLGLTTLRPPADQLGEEASRLLLAQLDGQPTALQVGLRPDLVVRGSTQRDEE